MNLSGGFRENTDINDTKDVQKRDACKRARRLKIVICIM